MKEKICIDVQKLAEKLVAQWEDLTHKSMGRHHVLPRTVYKKIPVKEQIQIIAQLITDSIDLNITWVDGNARWGQFELSVRQSKSGNSWTGLYKLDRTLAVRVANINGEDRFKTQELAQAACEQALRSIVCGRSRTMSGDKEQKLEDIFGIDSSMTEGKSVDEFLKERRGEVSGISKTIKLIRKLYEADDKGDFVANAADSIMPIIEAYEQSQKELEKYWDMINKHAETIAELSAANKRIAELERKVYRYKKGFARKVMSKPQGADR